MPLQLTPSAKVLPFRLDTGPESFPPLLGRCKQKQRGLRGLLCRWPSITGWEMHITAQGPPPVSEMTYTVSSGTLNSTVPYHPTVHTARLGRVFFCEFSLCVFICAFYLFVCPHSFMFPWAVESSPLQFLAL